MSGFRDRQQAGDRLAEQVGELGLAHPLVLGMPRGGVPVAQRVALALGAPLDVVVVRKIGAPHNPEAAIGAVAAGGNPLFDSDVLAWLRLAERDMIDVVEAEKAEAQRRVRVYRGDRPAPEIAGSDAVVVDDGLATGMSARAAVADVRDRDPASVTLAVPVGAPGAVRSVGELCDHVVCVQQPPEFGAVSLWYDDFPQVSDAEVQNLLTRGAHHQSA